MRTGFSEVNDILSVTTSFGKDVLLIEGLSGTEELSRPFAFHLSMRSGKVALDPNTIVGTTATVKVKHPDGAIRYFHGVINRFTHAGLDADFAYYEAEMVPSLWLLSLSRDRVIWQNKTPIQIIESVLTTHSVAFQKKITGSYEVRDYCVQYDESPLDFISRLMEQEGIFYFFTFSSGGHTMVLADAPSAHVNVAPSTLKFRGRIDTNNLQDSVLRFEAGGQLVTQNFSGSDYHYVKPSTALVTKVAGAAGRGTIYDYPHARTTVDAGKKILGVRLQASQIESSTASGESSCNGLYAGGAFTLAEHPNGKLNIRYAIRRVTHRATGSGYTNHFEAFPAANTFRPPHSVPRPIVHGSHSALVVGPKGEEIWTDSMGRIKVKFYWDQSAAKDETSSCWVRVAQTWAGNGWGTLFIPRIGNEVIISYLDGDPDRPIVSGSVYNGERATPVTLPASQTQSLLRSRPSKGSSGISKTTAIEAGRMHGNEIRFEDKVGDEELYLHAEHDMKVDIENDLDSTLYKGDEVHLIKKGNRKIEVTKGNETHIVGGKRTLTITGDESHTNSGNFTHTIKKSRKLSVTKDNTETIKGNSTIKVSGNLVIDVTGSITFKSGKAMTVSSGAAMTVKSGAAMTIKSGAGLSSQAATAFSIKAGTSLSAKALTFSAKASASATVNGGGMLTLKGGMVKIN